MFEEYIDQCEAELELYSCELQALREDDIPDDEQEVEISSLEESIRSLRSQLVELRAALREISSHATANVSTPDTPASSNLQGLPDDAVRWGDEAHYTAREQLLSHPDFSDGRVPREYGMEGLSEIAPKRLQSINDRAVAAGRTPLEPGELPSGVIRDLDSRGVNRQLDPHGPPQGENGHVTQYNWQGRATRDSSNRLMSINEHGVPQAQLRHMSTNPATGETQYVHGPRDVSYRNGYDPALDKTHVGDTADNPSSRRMREAIQAGQAPEFAETFIDRRANAHRANAAHNFSVPGQSIDYAFYHQMTYMSGANTTQQTMDALASMPDEPTTLNMTSFDEDFMSSFSDDAIPETRVSSVPDGPAPGAAMSMVDEAVPQSRGVLRGVGRAAQFAGDSLSVAGVALSGYQVGSGVNQVIEGDVAQGSVNIVEGSTNIGMEIGTTYAIQSGAVVAEGGAAAVSVTVLAGAAATGALAWAFEDTRRALDGQPTMLDEAIEAWSTDGFDVWRQFAAELPNLGDVLMGEDPPEDEVTNIRGLPDSDAAD